MSSHVPRYPSSGLHEHVGWMAQQCQKASFSFATCTEPPSTSTDEQHPKLDLGPVFQPLYMAPETFIEP
jgi:hypothetical protein